jgi:D-alanyl-D-alanine carboxypeptidase/D-alanyl-D-alanine-endopeptidase (penicillin-binding protein 4)
MLRLLGRQYGLDGSFAQGARVVRQFLLNVGVPSQDFFFYDGSGMSTQDRITPRAFTQLLRYVAAQPWGAQFRSTLPVGGVDGSLAGRFFRTPLQGRVFAKTGTLREVSALSGYVRARSGKLLVFSILCNDERPDAKAADGSPEAARTTDAIVAAMAAAN